MNLDSFGFTKNVNHKNNAVDISYRYKYFSIEHGNYFIEDVYVYIPNLPIVVLCS